MKEKGIQMELNGKRLLILGGSRISCEIIRYARKKGITTGVVDWYPLEQSPAKQMADEAYYESTSDIDAMVNLIREKHFDGVITGFTDSVLPYYAEICSAAGLPCYGTKEQFEMYTDKQKYKELLRKYDVPTVPEYHIDFDRFEETAIDVRYPVLVKPVDGSGSRGITICHDQDKLREAIQFGIKSSKSKRIIVEQYLDEPEATVFWVFVNGVYKMVLLGNRHVKHNQKGELPLPAGYTYPSAIQPKFLADTAPKMERMFRETGIKNGMIFMQCKVVDGICLVYDIGFRLTGSLEYKNINATCGFDPLEMLITFALIGDMGEPDFVEKADPYLHGKYSYNVSILCKPGKIALITGIEQVKALPGVLDVVIAHEVGDTITEAMKGRLAQITVRVLGKADTIEQMKQEMLHIQKTIHVVSDQGEEMVLPGLEENDFEGTVYE